MAAITAQMKKRMKPFEDAMARANLPRGFATDSYLIGYDNGREEGRSEGKAEGMARGEALGRAEGLARAVLAVLKARGLSVTAAQRTRVLACDDVATLDQWIARAATASTTAAALAGRTARPRRNAAR